MTLKLPEETLKKLERLGTEYDAIVQDMLTDGIEPLQKQIESNLKEVIGRGVKSKPRSMGNLIKAIRVTKAYQVTNGDWHIKVGIYGYDKYDENGNPTGTPNALKAMVLEHGRSDMAAKPWLKPAISATKKQCVQAMVDTFDKKVDKL